MEPARAVKLALLALAAGGLLLGGLAVVLSERSPDARSAGSFVGSEPPARFTMPPFALRDHDGSLVRSGDLRGKVAVLTFLDTKCVEACPIIAWEVASAWRRLSEDERREVVVLAISTDPRNDTPASVRAFLRRHRALETFRYLTAPVAEMKPLWQTFQVLSSFESGDPDTHSAPVRIYGRDGVWLATLHADADLTASSLVHDVRVALGRSP